jgi:hypothetical protein
MHTLKTLKAGEVDSRLHIPSMPANRYQAVINIDRLIRTALEIL